MFTTSTTNNVFGQNLATCKTWFGTHSKVKLSLLEPQSQREDGDDDN